MTARPNLPEVLCRHCSQAIEEHDVLGWWRHVHTKEQRCFVTFAEPPESDESGTDGLASDSQGV